MQSRSSSERIRLHACKNEGNVFISRSNLLLAKFDNMENSRKAYLGLTLHPTMIIARFSKPMPIGDKCRL
jgi:hypothetical protein